MTAQIRLKWLLDEVDERARERATELPLLSVSIVGGVRPRSDTTGPTRAAADDLSTYKVCHAGELVINRMRAFQGALGVAPESGLVSPDYAVLRLSPEIEHRWLNYLLTSDAVVAEMASLVRGIGGTEAGNVRTPRLNVSDLLAMRIGLEPLKIQRAIADFLDRETARIDTLIEEQHRLIELLRERLKATSEEAVAALDWTVPLHSVTTLIQTGPFGSQLKSDEYVPGGIPIINPSHLTNGNIEPDARIAVSDTKASELARHAFQAGDIAVARRGELGRCSVVRDWNAGMLCGTGSALVRPDATCADPDFIALVFGSRRNRDVLSLQSVGSTMDNLNADIIAALRIPLPPLTQQRLLVDQVGMATASVRALITETEKFIELSRERRSALITAAVTGQIDVKDRVA